MGTNVLLSVLRRVGRRANDVSEAKLTGPTDKLDGSLGSTPTGEPSACHVGIWPWFSQCNALPALWMNKLMGGSDNFSRI